MIVYLVKSTLLLALLFGLYKLLLENEKMHRFNRFFLLFVVLFGLTAPLISFEVNPESSLAGMKMQHMETVVNAPAEAVSKSVEPLIAPKPQPAPVIESNTGVASEPGWSLGAVDVLLGIYVLVTLMLFVRFAAGLLKIREKVKEGTHKNLDKATLILLDEPITPQSFFKFIFMEKEKFHNGKIEVEILDHELTHVRQLHSVDVLFVEFLKVVFWFNPLIYFFKHAIQLNHEFIADESVVDKTPSIKKYQELLLKVCSQKRPMNTASGISHPHTKKRFRMMLKHFSPFKTRLKVTLLLPLVTIISISFCTKADRSNGFSSYPDIKLSASVVNQGGEVFGGPILRYKDPEGEYYTGNQNYYSRKTDKVVSTNQFENGYRTASISYNDQGEESFRYEFGYVGNSMVTLRKFNSAGTLVEEWINPENTKDSLGSIREWYSNSQLKFEVQWKGDTEYHGLMTLYDEQGNILEQERHEDGELIQKIR